MSGDKPNGNGEKPSHDLFKAYSIDFNGLTSNVREADDQQQLFTRAGALNPPYEPETLMQLFEHSASLRPNVDAMATNIDGFGHRWEAVIDFEAGDADQRVASLIWEARRAKLGPSAPEPTQEDISAEKKRLVEAMRVERVWLERFFAFCVDGISFVSLRRKTRQDLEVQGNGYWEILRNQAGDIAEFTYIPAFTIRLLPLDKERTTVRNRRKRTETEYEEIERSKHLRRFVQVSETQTTYFKDFGDPRTISSKTNAVYADSDALRRAEPGVSAATELIHFRLHSPRSAYGVPRWIGSLLAVLGQRQAEEVNFSYFDNKSVPPLALLVSGGHLSESSVDQIKKHIEGTIKGRGNFHRILVLEAEGDSSTLSGSGNVRMEFKPLTDAQNKDALFQEYDTRSTDKAAMAFRIPRLLRGDVRDFNRATADASLEFAERQVFGPEREDFDELINRKILAALGIRFWKMRSNSPRLQDPHELAVVIKLLCEASVLTVAEARELSEDIFNRQLKNIDAPWTQLPATFSLAGLTAEGDALVPYLGPNGTGVSPPAAFDDLDANGSPDASGMRAARAASRVEGLRRALLAYASGKARDEFAARREAGGDADDAE